MHRHIYRNTEIFHGVTQSVEFYAKIAKPAAVMKFRKNVLQEVFVSLMWDCWVVQAGMMARRL